MLAFALISRLTRRCSGKSLAGTYGICSYTSLNTEKVQQKYKNRVSGYSFSLLATIRAIITER